MGEDDEEDEEVSVVALVVEVLEVVSGEGVLEVVECLCSLQRQATCTYKHTHIVKIHVQTLFNTV